MLEKINSFLWGNGLVFLLLITGFVYTIRLRFIQIKAVPYVVRMIFRKTKPENSGLNQCKTVCLALGTAMGTGNITGVSAALAIGGVGAVFWMWVSAFLGMALVYAENSLSAIFSDSEYRGPMAYISKGLGSRKLALCFAVFCLLASLGMGGMVQVNAVSENININGKILAPIVFIIILLIVSGGTERIGSAAQFLLPIASLLYTAACIFILSRHLSALPNAFSAIFRCAFGFRQTIGGFSGTVISRSVSVGIRRGIFSNEAGLGSSPLLHSASESNNSEMQGMCSMFEVFLDTIVCCTLTAVTLLCSAPDFSVSTAFSTLPGGIGDNFIAADLTVFALCTIIGWYYCGETAFRFITPSVSTKGFCIIYAAISALGAVLHSEMVWTLSDIFNGLMAFPNLCALLLLIKKVKRE